MATQPESEIRSDVRPHRTPEYDIAPLFVNRWSPRAMTGEPLEEDTFLPLFEAARWAPSSYNNQSWRFLYATRGSEDWDAFLDLVYDGNRTWAKDAAVLVVILSKKTFDHNGEPSRTHSFDVGAAWQNLALEGARRGLAVHAMEGFDYEGAADVLSVPDDFAVEAMVAIGVQGSEERLPEQLRSGETPSDRKPLDAIATEGAFSFDGDDGSR